MPFLKEDDDIETFLFTPELQIWLKEKDAQTVAGLTRCAETCRSARQGTFHRQENREEKTRLDKKAEQTESLNLNLLTEVNVPSLSLVLNAKIEVTTNQIVHKIKNLQQDIVIARRDFLYLLTNLLRLVILTMCQLKCF